MPQRSKRRTSEHSAAPSAHRQQTSKFQTTGSEPALPEKVASLHNIAEVKVPNDSSDDEFGLSDPDFAEELTDLAAQYEPQGSAMHSHSATRVGLCS